MVARGLGVEKMTEAQRMECGRLLTCEYQAKYGRAPPSEVQYIDGKEKSVNRYTTSERDLMEKVVKIVCKLA